MLALPIALRSYKSFFLWEGKYHLVNWSKVCSPILEWGLRVTKLIVFDWAFLEMWLWCYAFERESLHGEQQWIVNMATCWVGGVLVRLMSHTGLGFGSLSERVGESSLYTLDSRWGIPLKLDFGMLCRGANPYGSLSRVVQYSSLQRCFCSRYVQLASDSHQWNASFNKASHDWKVDFFTTFFDFLYSIRLRRGWRRQVVLGPFK